MTGSGFWLTTMHDEIKLLSIFYRFIVQVLFCQCQVFGEVDDKALVDHQLLVKFGL